ncbi:MAG TPA: hypothetical protein PLR12_02785 [Clostridia bacterium]|nr:hypothetical protein [Clostridia bacterium]
MKKLHYIQVHKTEEEALSAINKLYRQGFRPDQVAVLAYNTDRFHTLYRDQAVPMSASDEHAADKLPDQATIPDPPIVPVVPAAVAGDATRPGAPVPPVPLVAARTWKDLGDFRLDKDAQLAHEAKLTEGDILVILQTDEGQVYRPDLPLIHGEDEVPLRTKL